jgi:hypothetical protein
MDDATQKELKVGGLIVIDVSWITRCNSERIERQPLRIFSARSKE